MFLCSCINIAPRSTIYIFGMILVQPLQGLHCVPYFRDPPQATFWISDVHNQGLVRQVMLLLMKLTKI